MSGSGAAARSQKEKVKGHIGKVVSARVIVLLLREHRHTQFSSLQISL